MVSGTVFWGEYIELIATPTEETCIMALCICISIIVSAAVCVGLTMFPPSEMRSF